MDAVDRKILGELQRDGRITVTELAERLPLSVSATSDRLRRLLDTGVVRSFTAVVDPRAVGRTIEAIVDVRLRPSTYAADDDELLRTLPAVVDAIHLTGRFDLQLRVVARDVAELDALLETLKDDYGAEETNTRLVLRTVSGFPRPITVADSA